jgi:hypothetical protein
MTSTEHPSFDTARKDVIAAVRNFKPSRGMNKVPGMPVSYLSATTEGEALRSLLADGTLKLIEVTKPSKVDPTRTMTYAYLVVADR